MLVVLVEKMNYDVRGYNDYNMGPEIEIIYLFQHDHELVENDLEIHHLQLGLEK